MASSVITPVHPAFRGKNYTTDDCYLIGLSSGVAPTLVAGIISGRIKPDSTTYHILLPFMGKNLTEAYESWDPTALYEFHKTPPTRYEIVPYAVASTIEPKDFMKLESGEWILISDTAFTATRIMVYSGATFVASLNNNARVTIARHPKNNSDTPQDNPNDDRIGAEKRRMLGIVESNTQDAMDQSVSRLDRTILSEGKKR